MIIAPTASKSPMFTLEKPLSVLTAIAWGFGTAFATAGEPPVHNPAKMVQVQVEFIELPQKTLTKLLLEAGRSVADGRALRMKVQEWVDKDQANVLETQIVVSPGKVTATSESIQQFLHPTEYDPGTFLPPGSTVIGLPITQPLPKSFNTKNLGSTLELKMGPLEDPRRIEFQLQAELAWNTGNTVWAERKDALGNLSQVKVPEFFFVRIRNSILCVPGRFVLVAVQSPQNAKGRPDLTRKLMVFLKCDVVPSK